MARIVKCGLIQAKNAAPTDAAMDEIKRLNIEKHLGFIEQAANQGVQILCMQEVFTTPYFCAEQQTRWYEAVERIPDGPTVKADAGHRQTTRHGHRRADLRRRNDRRVLQHGGGD